MGLRVPAAHREIERAVFADHHVGHVERGARPLSLESLRRDEVFPRPDVGSAARLEMDRDQAAIRPVVNVERLLILRRELRAVAERHAGRAADPDDGDRRIAVGIVLGPLGAPLAEAAVAAAHRVEDADRAVPRSAPVPFHVAVEAEELAVGV